MKFRFSLSLVFLFFLSIFSLRTALAATITVTERDDFFDGTICSLRNAVQSVNTGMDFGGCSHTGSDYGTGDDTIILEGGAPYVLSITTGGVTPNDNGDLDVTANVLIQGQGAEVTTIMGAFSPGMEDRIFDTSAQAVTLSQLTVTNGITSNGGGIANTGTLFIDRCRIIGNQAFGDGGGVYNLNRLAIEESTIDNNQAGNGGGIFNGFDADFIIENSTISNNHAIGANAQGFNGSGGGVFISTTCGFTGIQNSTISGNDVAQLGGGIFVQSTSCGAAADTVGGQGVVPLGVFLFNDTITLNRSPQQAGGIWFIPPFTTVSVGPEAIVVPVVNMANTILAGNEAPSNPDCFSGLVSSGFNVLGSTDGCTLFNSDSAGHPDQPDTDPQLGPLQNNGGPTFTHGLPSDSPAVDKGNNIPDEGCTVFDFAEIINNGLFNDIPLVRDQRNFLRPIAVRDPNTPICDVGAFEFQVFDFTVTKDDGLGGAEIEVGTNFDYTITVTNNGPGTATAVTLNDPLPAGMSFVAVTPSQGTCTGGATISCDLGDLAVGESATIIVSVTATENGDFTNIVTITLNNPFQQQLTETAQVTTRVTGVFVEGGGIHCELQRGAISASPRFAVALMGMSLMVFGIYFTVRRRINY